MTPEQMILCKYREARSRSFKWGETDCLAWAGEVYTALTGKDVLASLRGRYDSERSAKRVMVEEGWKSLGDVAASFFPEIPVAEARSGDWALVDEAGIASIGVFAGHRLFIQSGNGVRQVRRSHARRAFRIS